MILSQAQASGIYDSMCIANNLGGYVNMKIGSHTKTLIELCTMEDGSIAITGDSNDMSVPVPREVYPNQDAFAAAYGLN